MKVLEFKQKISEKQDITSFETENVEVFYADFKSKKIKKNETIEKTSGKIVSSIEIEEFPVSCSLSPDQRMLMGAGFGQIINILLKKNG